MKRWRIITVILLGLLGLTLFAVGCGQKSESQTGTSQSDTPKQVATKWLNNLKSGNWGATYDALSSVDKKKMTRQQWIDAYNKQGKTNTDATFTVTGEKITGDSATVSVHATQGGQSQDGAIPLVKEGNTWKINASASTQTQ